MHAQTLVLRCYSERVGDQWQAFCLDLTLAAQADSQQEAEKKLRDMMVDYVWDVLGGEDAPHAGYLLRRKAPLRYWLKYYFFLNLQKIGMVKDNVRHLFYSSLPLEPHNPSHA